jgi:hypothetical protein
LSFDGINDFSAVMSYVDIPKRRDGVQIAIAINIKDVNTIRTVHNQWRIGLNHLGVDHGVVHVVGVATSDIVCSVHWLKHRQLGVMDKIYYSQVFPNPHNQLWVYLKPRSIKFIKLGS